jgi:hypothetical protein
MGLGDLVRLGGVINQTNGWFWHTKAILLMGPD